MPACQGKIAIPPCVYSVKGFNLGTSSAYYLVTIHDSSGTHVWS